jgi:hypothetical protein
LLRREGQDISKSWKRRLKEKDSKLRELLSNKIKEKKGSNPREEMSPKKRRKSLPRRELSLLEDNLFMRRHQRKPRPLLQSPRKESSL